MSFANQAASNEPTRPETSLRQAVRRHRLDVDAKARALREWSASTADDDHALRERLAGIRQRLSTALHTSGRRTAEPVHARPGLRIVRVHD
jgi:hypothetical protein